MDVQKSDSMAVPAVVSIIYARASTPLHLLLITTLAIQENLVCIETSRCGNRLDVTVGVTGSQRMRLFQRILRVTG